MVKGDNYSTDIPPNILIDLYCKMVLIRHFEEKIIEVYPQQDMKTPVHLYIGQEAIASAVCANLKKEDYVFTNHRSHGHCLAKGVNPKVLLAEFYGRRSGCCKGKGGSMHPADPESGILGTSAIVGGCIPLAVGTALASAMKRDGRVSVAFFGDGAVDGGAFHESLNFASLKKLPVIFICENNFYATNSPISSRQPHDNIAKRAEGYGIPGIQVDGNDVLEIYRVSKEAVERARDGKGPTLIECRTYRWKGHVGPDCDYEKGCRPKEELETWMKRCPIEHFKGYLLKNRIMTESGIKELTRKIDDEIEEAVIFGKESPFPEKHEVTKDVYFGDK